MTTPAIALFVATFLACLVEAVEAVTIIIAAGSSRNWRSALQGTVVAALVLVVAVAIFGPLITLLPIEVLRLVVGGLLLVFGLQWIRKAVLRASGRKALHDEDLIFAKESAAARAAATESRGFVSDWYGFTLAFKGTLLEGLEVVFVVITFGTNAIDPVTGANMVPLASLAAAIAIVITIILGVAVRGPLSRVPENTLKFVVGILLTAFGIFWAGEGAGANWPGADVSLLVIAPAVAVVSLILVAVLRRPAVPSAATAPAAAPASGAPVADGGTATATVTETKVAAAPAKKPSRLKAFGMFWYDFLIGDDWQVAVLVVISMIVTAIVAVGNPDLAWIATCIVILVTMPYMLYRALRAAH